MTPSLLAISKQQVAFSVLHENQNIYVSAIYASTAYLQRRLLWAELLNLQQSYIGPWCFVGDFNAVLGAHESRGGHLPLRISCEDFQDWTDTGNLTHVLTRGAEFTWANGRRGASLTEKRLDRAVCNDSWLHYWDHFTCCTLTRSNSDHHPILLSTCKGPRSFPSHFKFQSMWNEHPDCHRLVSEVWKTPVVGCSMYVLSQKLKILKKELRTWNAEIFGDVHLQVKKAQATVDTLQKCMNDSGCTDDLLEQETLAQVELQRALHY